ncbi:hypothetical protein E2562_025053 [Oryza meyeriana var. granulata]|uniref:Cytochrome b561 domain-containing protein n=1 Tax=Oryza meyeriana var. granulata TaxID=110450 RepID=A0A6G1D7I1_9ORYZ|nr:hypothetical protein E2562_025053 [Oryza meyeriana var. granulata]
MRELVHGMRVFPLPDPAWFDLHVAFQCSGYIIGAVALFPLETLQVFALLMRPKKTVKVRFYWKLYHWSVGYTIVILSVINVSNVI